MIIWFDYIVVYLNNKEMAIKIMKKINNMRLRPSDLDNVISLERIQKEGYN